MGTKVMSDGLRVALGYSSQSAGEDVGGMLTANTTGGLGQMSVGDSTNPSGDFDVANWPNVPIQPLINNPSGLMPRGGYLTDLVDSMAEDTSFETSIRKISLALDHLDEDELAEQLKAAKQINVLANQILAITFQSGLGDVEVSQALVAEAQALKARALTILRAILDFIAENYEDEEEEDGDDD